jgi:hypothetical protein
MRTASAFLILSAGCGAADSAPPVPQVPPALEDVPLAADGFERHLLSIARAYRGFGRVDDETRWAPGLCRQPLPSRARFSASSDPETHGRKLYYVFARKRQDYLTSTRPRTPDDAPRPAQPVGQVLVKESWTPADEGPDPATPSIWDVDWKHVMADDPRGFSPGTRFPLAWKDGRRFRASGPAGLFVMFKTAPGTPGTDGGWVYGTVSADLKTVTSSGRVAACMACHVRTPHDRLFGLPAGP